MNLRIRRLRDNEIEDLVQLSLLAWAPVFSSFERILGSGIYARLYPDWITSQRATVEEICGNSGNIVWIAELDGAIAGFIACELNTRERIGEIQLLAVHPDEQDRGIGTALNIFALGKMKDAGMTLAVVGTGGDPAHAPARRSYEKAGFVALPLVRYYKDL